MLEKEDNFSHRLDSYDAVELQYNIACEELVRGHFGKVHVKRFILKPKQEDGSLDKKLIELLIRDIKKLSSVQILNRGIDGTFLLSDEWAIKLDAEHQLTGLESGAEESCDSSVLVSIKVELHFIDLTIFSQIEEIADKLGFNIVYGFESEKGVPVTFTFPGTHGIDYVGESFEGLKLQDVAQNYTPDVVEQVEALLKYAKEVNHGIVVLSGEVGTGKSYLIRSILTELSQRRAVVCTPPTQFLVQAGLLAQVVANFKKSLVVLEDVGEVIAMDSASKYVDARANLLNFTEGFLSLLTDAIVIISFNYDLEKIDPAILRPGRCLANITIGKLPYTQAQELVPFEIPKKQYSLAEVYELRRVGKVIVPSKSQMGFVRS